MPWQITAIAGEECPQDNRNTAEDAMRYFRPRLTPLSGLPGDPLAASRGVLLAMALSAGFWVGLGAALRSLPG